MFVITDIEKHRMLRLLELVERNPKSALAEGWRRNANVFDDLEFIYSACSSGKDSAFMTQMAVMELQRRRMLLEMWRNPETRAEAEELVRRYSAVRECGLASQVKEDLNDPECRAKFEKWENMRIAVMQMAYELEFDQSGQLMHRFYKEYATDINNILPKNADDSIWDSGETVKELGFDLRWVNTDDTKCNPGELSLEKIEKLTPKQLREIYGKALVWGYDCCFPIAWENSQGVNDSRYISFEPDKKDIWVTEPPVKWDPHHEWCLDINNMYDSWHGLRPMFEITPGMTDQNLRVEFSRFISDAVTHAMENGWPAKKYNDKTGEFD